MFPFSFAWTLQEMEPVKGLGGTRDWRRTSLRSYTFPPPSKKRIYNSTLWQLLPSFSHQEKVNKIKPPLPDDKPWSQGVGVVALRKLPERVEERSEAGFSLKLAGAPGPSLDWTRNTGPPGAARLQWEWSWRCSVSSEDFLLARGVLCSPVFPFFPSEDLPPSMCCPLICPAARVLHLQPSACVQPPVCLWFLNCTTCVS